MIGSMTTVRITEAELARDVYAVPEVAQGPLEPLPLKEHEHVSVTVSDDRADAWLERKYWCGDEDQHGHRYPCRGRTLSVRISWGRSAGNRAEFTVSQSPNFFEGAPVAFGSASDRGSHWSGKVPGAGDYYIYVVAHPATHYTLRVTASQVQNAR